MAFTDAFAQGTGKKRYPRPLSACTPNTIQKRELDNEAENAPRSLKLGRGLPVGANTTTLENAKR